MSAASAKRTPGDGGRLHRDAIVDAAISVADADGINALSMRRVADELGVGAMSLYRHIDDKDALLQAMAEAIGRRYPYPVTQDWPWRRRVEAAVEIDWELYRDHPWVVLIYSTPRYSFGADSLEGLDWLAGGFLQLDVDIVRATEMGIAVWNLVNGIVLATVGESLLSGEAPGEVPGGLADILAGRVEVALPHLAALVGDDAAHRLLDARASLDAGLAYLCAGFEAAAEVEGGAGAARG